MSVHRHAVGAGILRTLAAAKSRSGSPLNEHGCLPAAAPAPIREAIKGGGFDAVLFTSSSTVRNLVGIAGKPHAVTVIGVIGPQTAKTAAEFGLRVDVTAPKPSMTALVDAMAEYGATLRDAAVQAGEPVRRPSERRRGARRRLR